MTKRGWKACAGLALLAVTGWLAAGGVAMATMPIQKKAKEAGFAATTCLYCHNEKLPKKGAATHNERGKWLLDQKAKQNTKEVDAAWLKDYVEPKK